MSVRAARIGHVVVPSGRRGVTLMAPKRCFERRLGPNTRLSFSKGVKEKSLDPKRLSQEEMPGQQLVLKVYAGEAEAHELSGDRIPITAWRHNSDPRPASFDVPPSIPIEVLAQMVHGITEREDGSCLMTITKPGVQAFPNVFEHKDRVYGIKIDADTKIQLGWIVAYVLKRDFLESELLIGRVVAGPGCIVKISDGRVTVTKKSNGYIELYDIQDNNIDSQFTIDGNENLYFIITEREVGRRFFLNGNNNPLLVDRSCLRYKLRYLEGERVKTGPDIAELGYAFQQSIRQGDWRKKLVTLRGEPNALYTIIAIGPAKSVGDHGVDLNKGDLLVRRVNSHGHDKKVHISEIDARIIPEERQL